MRKLLAIIAIQFFLGCKENNSISMVSIMVEYERGDKDTLLLQVYGDPAGCSLRNGCLNYTNPAPHKVLDRVDRVSAACFVRRFEILKWHKKN